MATGRNLAIGAVIGLIVGGAVAGLLTWQMSEQRMDSQRQDLTDRLTSVQDDAKRLTSDLEQARGNIERWKADAERAQEKIKTLLDSHIPREELEAVRTQFEDAKLSAENTINDLQEQLTAGTSKLEQQLTDQAAEHTARIDAMAQRLTSATGELANVTAERDQIKASLSAVEANLDQRTQELADAKAQIGNLEQKITDLQAQLKKLESLGDMLNR